MPVTEVQVRCGEGSETYKVHDGHILAELDAILGTGLLELGFLCCFFCGEWFPRRQMQIMTLKLRDGARHKVAKCPECRVRTVLRVLHDRTGQ